MYEDGNGLGAMNVRPSTEDAIIAAGGSMELEQEVPEAPAQTAAKPSYGKANKSHGGGQSDWGNQGKWAGQDKDWKKQTGGKSAGKADWSWDGGYRPSHKGGNQGGYLSPEKVLDKAHDAIHTAVWEATQSITHMEETWEHKEFAKRVTKYLYKSASTPNLMSQPWYEAAVAFVEKAMQGYSAGCGDKSWFYDLDLAPAFVAGFNQLVQLSQQRPKWQDVEAAINTKYEELMDESLFDKAVWDVLAALTQDEPIRNKIFKALKAGHEGALKEAQVLRRVADLQKVELFTRRWMEISMGKLWQVFENAGILMAEDTIVNLFADLVAPFGEEHPFSCIPAALTATIGRPPRDWPFLHDAAAEYIAANNNPSAAEVDGGSKSTSYYGMLKAGYSAPKKQRTNGYGKAEPDPAAEEADPLAEALLADLGVS